MISSIVANSTISGPAGTAPSSVYAANIVISPRISDLYWIVFAVFSILLIVVSTFHEPWFDEAQAWQIARCASFKEILFTIPHYEGHPPLWHLLLSVPAKLGMPYELSLKGISCLIAMAVTMLIVFKAPFPKYIRFLVPFGYFCFYQFGVVARPYQLLTLAILLTAVYYKTKDVHSIRFVLCLAFLCMTSAYGIILAGGIAFAWLFDILLSKPWSSFKNIVCDSRVWSLFVLLIFAVFLGLNLLPEKNTYALRGIENRFSWEYLLTCYFAYFTDSFLRYSLVLFSLANYLFVVLNLLFRI